MTSSDLLRALTPVVEVLEVLGIRYFVGGSVASSAHGVPRASVDADVVADLHAEHVDRFVAALGDAYYVPEGIIRDAVGRRRSFNLIHLASMFKIDVFVSKGRAFDREALSRAGLETLAEGVDARSFRVATPEDTILSKLEWYRLSGGSSERQWSDIVGVLAMNEGLLDRGYLTRWAAVLDVADLLDRAIADAKA